LLFPSIPTHWLRQDSLPLRFTIGANQRSKMKLVGALFLALLPSVFGISNKEIGCEGNGPAEGEAISTLEEAGLQAVIQTLFIDPKIPIAMTTDATYTLKINAPGDRYFNALLMRAALSHTK